MNESGQIANSAFRQERPFLLSWALQQINAPLRNPGEAAFARDWLERLSLPTHPDFPKCWDTLIAVIFALSWVDTSEGILDAGAEYYSSFLPALNKLGYNNLIAMNIAFSSYDYAGGVLYRPGDITASDLPAERFVFISCLSVIEHGVDITEFFREQSRLLKVNGRLFISTDYWEDPVDVRGQSAFGVPIRIFDRPSILEVISVAERFGLFLDSEPSFTCDEAVVHWQPFDLHYTFINLLFRKGAKESDI